MDKIRFIWKIDKIIKKTKVIFFILLHTSQSKKKWDSEWQKFSFVIMFNIIKILFQSAQKKYNMCIKDLTRFSDAGMLSKS